MKQREVVFTAFANPKGDLTNLTKEQNSIQDALLPLEGQGRIKKHLVRTDTDLLAYFEFLREYKDQISIFHYGGHADSQGISFQNAPIFFKPLAEELVNRNPNALMLVVLNGCCTKAHIKVLFDLGVKAVIATSSEVNDSAATDFAARFYKNLSSGDNLETAYKSAANFVKGNSKEHRFKHFGEVNRGFGFPSAPESAAGEFPWGLYVHSDDAILSHTFFTETSASAAMDDTQEALIFSQAFDAFLGHDLSPLALLGPKRSLQRYGFKEDFYVERNEVDKKIKDLVEKERNILLIGKPLSGKSRSILFYINTYCPDKQVFLLQEEDVISDATFQNVNKSIAEINEQTFFVINDIDKYIDIDGFEEMLDTLLENKNIILLATCRTSSFRGLKFDIPNILDCFEIIEIPKITDKIVTQIKTGLGEIKNTLIPDDTIGSYFVPITEIINRYESLSTECKEILRSYKCVEMIFKRTRGDIDKIREITQYRLQYLSGNKGLLFPPGEANKAIDELINLDFVEKKGDKIFVETAYVDRVIAQDDTNESLCKTLIQALPVVETYNKIIQRVPEDKIADWTFQEIKAKGLQPDEFTYRGYIVRKDNPSEAINRMKDLMRKENYTPDPHLVNLLIKKSTNYEESWEILQMFKELETPVPFDEITWYTLFSKFQRLKKEQILQILDQLKSSPFEFTVITYNKLISASLDSGVAFMLYEELCRKGLKPSERTFFGLLTNAKGYPDVLTIFIEASNNNIELDSRFIISCFNRINDYDGRIGFFQYLLHAGHDIPPYAVTLILNSSKDFDDGYALLEQINDNPKVSFEAVSYNAILKKCKSFYKAKMVLEKMNERGVHPSLNTLNLVLRSINNQHDALNFYSQFFVEPVKPDSYTFYHLIHKSSSFEQSMYWFQKCIESNIKPNIHTYQVLIKTAAPVKNSDANVMGIFTLIKDSEYIVPNSDTMWSILNHTRKLNNSWEVYRWMRAKGIGVDTAIFNQMLQCCSSYEEGMEVFEEITRNGFNPTPKNWALLIKADESMERAWQTLDKMIDLGINPDVYPFNYLMYKAANSESESKRVFEKAMEMDAIRNTNKRDIKDIHKFIVKYIELIPDFNSAKETYRRYKDHGGISTIEIYDALLKRFRNEDEQRWIFYMIDADELKYSANTYNTLIFKERNLQRAYSLALDMRDDGVTPNDKSFIYVLYKCRYDEDIIDAIKDFKLDFDFKINMEILRTIMKKTQDKLYVLKELTKIFNEGKLASIDDLMDLDLESMMQAALNIWREKIKRL